MKYKIENKEQLEAFILENWSLTNEYICKMSKDLPIPIYSSVDVRESKTKFAPVDHNMYPAGYNNICKVDLKKCADYFKECFLKLKPTLNKVAIIPESHTKNLFYLDHLFSLKSTLELAGFKTEILSLDHSLFAESDVLDLTSMSAHSITIKKAIVKDHHIVSQSGEVYELVLLNHDQSNPLDVDWKTLKTLVLPSPQIGWFRRQKIEHFTFYKKVADAFCEHFSINPELIQAKFSAVDNVDFNAKNGLEDLGRAVDDLVAKLPSGNPVFVKASQGTYGMGISVVHSGEEIINMNRKVRNKMDIGKNNIKFTKVLIQEGIETIVKVDEMPAEITIYLVNGKAAGGFMRANPLRGSNENLNAKGMVYQKLCLADICAENEHKCKEAVYSVIARLSTIASAYEIKNVL